jgi:hypothetical protein
MYASLLKYVVGTSATILGATWLVQHGVETYYEMPDAWNAPPMQWRRPATHLFTAIAAGSLAVSGVYLGNQGGREIYGLVDEATS